MRNRLKLLGIGLALVAAAVFGGEALAQRASIEKSSNMRLSGESYATLSGLSYETCEQRCLSEAKCVALEHYRGGRITGRQSQCKLFSRAGETRPYRYSDVGFKRRGSGPSDTVADAKPRDESRRAADSRRQAEDARRQAEETAMRRAQELQRRAQEQQRQRESASPTAGGTTSSDRAYRETAPSAPPAIGQSSGQPRSAPPAASAPPPPPPMASAPPPPSAAPPAPPRTAPPAAPIILPPVASAPRPQSAPEPAPPAPVASAPAPSSEASQPRRTRSITRADETAPGAGTGGTAGTASAQTEWDIVPVFYGTDRNRRDQAKRVAYGSDRASRLELGRALVTVPKSHQVPNVERPWAIKIPYLDVTLYQESEDPKKHFTIKELRSMSKEELVQLVRERLGGSKNFKDQAFVLVHGYNNGFDDALYRAAQVAYDLKFDGAPFLYSWPSGSGITSYPYDRDSAQQAEPYLTQFLQMVLNETGARQVNLIAHSMGNQPLLQVLRYLKQANPGVASRINQIILAAPDVDRNAFEFLAEQIRGIGSGITMYVSANDVALGISKRFAGGVPRAGDVPDGLGPAVVAGIDTIDVSGLSTEYLALNHSTYAEKTALIQDIEMVLRTGMRPPEKRLPVLERVKSEKGDYWRYPR